MRAAGNIWFLPQCALRRCYACKHGIGKDVEVVSWLSLGLSALEYLDFVERWE